MFPGFGTIVNSLLVFAGSLLGLALSSRLPEGLKKGIMQAIGLFTLLLGLKLTTENKPELLKVFFLLVVGGAFGSLLRLEERLSNLGGKASEFSKGFISASLLFTVGPMTLMGCILEGAKGDSTLILSKAFMDFFSSFLLASSLGVGVVFSALYVLFFQGSITALAFFLGEFLKEQAMANALFIGGGLMVLTAFKIWGFLQEVRTLNLLPSMIFALFV